MGLRLEEQGWLLKALRGVALARRETEVCCFTPHTCLVHWLSSEAMMLTVRSSSSPAALSSFFLTCREQRNQSCRRLVPRLVGGAVGSYRPKPIPCCYTKATMHAIPPSHRTLSLPMKMANSVLRPC